MAENDSEIDASVVQGGSRDSSEAYMGGLTNNVTHNYDNSSTEAAFMLSFQSAYLKAQFDEIKHQMLGSVETCQEKEIHLEEKASEQVKQLQAEIKSLSKEILAHKETQKAAENALEHLRTEYTDADTKIQHLSSQLAEDSVTTLMRCTVRWKQRKMLLRVYNNLYLRKKRFWKRRNAYFRLPKKENKHQLLNLMPSTRRLQKA